MNWDALNLYNKLEDKKEEWAYELLRVCEKYGISEIKLEGTDLWCAWPGKKVHGKELIIRVDPGKYFNSLLDCFVVIYPDGDEIRFSRLRISPLEIVRLEDKIREIQWETEINPYELFPGFDRKKIHFSGETIMITDPAYCIPPQEDYIGYPDRGDFDCTPKELTLPEILRASREKLRYLRCCEEWRKENKKLSLEELGIRNYLVNPTLQGDCGFHIYNDTGEILGGLCSDSGEVGVYSLPEIISMGPEFEKWINRHTYWFTFIPNFTGDVWMEIEELDPWYDDKGKKHREHITRVIGKGNINFQTKD